MYNDGIYTYPCKTIAAVADLEGVGTSTQLGQLFHKSHIHTLFLSQTIDILDYINGIGNGCIFAQSTPLLLVGTETSILTTPISF